MPRHTKLTKPCNLGRESPLYKFSRQNIKNILRYYIFANKREVDLLVKHQWYCVI